jgi:hypothetical protein
MAGQSSRRFVCFGAITLLRKANFLTVLLKYVTMKSENQFDKEEDMVVIKILGMLLAWFILYVLVLKVGLYIQDATHRGALKKWKMDIEDYEHNRFKIKLYVSLFFIGISLLFFIGFVIYMIKGA